MGRVHGLLWTDHLTAKGYKILIAHSRSNGAAYDGIGDHRRRRLPHRRHDRVTGDRRYGVPGHKIANGRHVESEELTMSLMKVLSAFGMGSRGEIDGGGALERERTHG